MKGIGKREMDQDPGLFVPQAIHRIGTGGSHGLKNKSQNSNQQRDRTGQYKHNPSDISPVGKVLKPFIHHEPGQRPGQDIGHHDPFDEFLGQKYYHAAH